MIELAIAYLSAIPDCDIKDIKEIEFISLKIRLRRVSVSLDPPIWVKIALISLYGLVPLVFYSLGAYLLYTKFTFGEKEHAAIKKQMRENK